MRCVLSAFVTFLEGFYTPADVDGLTVQGVQFTKRGDWKPLPLSDIPPRVFSEVMRDLEQNPHTMEAFSSQGDGTLTIIKEKSATSFEVEQTVQTRQRAKTCTLDTRTDHIIVITTEPAPAGASTADATPASDDQGKKARKGSGPGLLDIIVVGR